MSDKSGLYDGKPAYVRKVFDKHKIQNLVMDAERILGKRIGVDGRWCDKPDKLTKQWAEFIIATGENLVEIYAINPSGHNQAGKIFLGDARLFTIQSNQIAHPSPA